MRFQVFKNKSKDWRKENLKNIVIAATVIFILITYFSIETVYLVKDDGCKIYTIIGPLNYKFQDGKKVRIKREADNIIINDSKIILTLESVDYGHKYSNLGDKELYTIMPFHYFLSYDEIDYMFKYNSPPEKITIQGHGGSKRQYWLHK